MTEAEWDAGSDDGVIEMFTYLTPRKRRLLACAWCRRVWPFLTDQGSREAVEATERHAGGLVADVEWERAIKEACRAGMKAGTQESQGLAAGTVGFLYWAGDPKDPALFELLDQTSLCLPHEHFQDYLVPLIRELVGNPFRPIAPDPAWLTRNDGCVRRLAWYIYDDRAFDRLPLLSDALEDAGSTNAAILDHCRQPGPHVRGCWVVDLLLGKS